MALAPEEVGARISERRRELGWTHERLAHEMHVGLRTVQRWQKGVDPKTGKSWLPRLATLMELADVMDVERSYFTEKPERVDQAQVQAQLLRAAADGIAELSRSQESVHERLDEVLERLGRLEAGLSSAADARQ
jgi:transcriptional regulator with XRE-family HTH domain